MANISTQQAELKALRELSAQLGRDPLLVQASTGNTSVKLGDSLWIKASGKWLINADSPDFLVSVDLNAAMRYFNEGIDIPETAVPCGGPRPSIETAMHAVLPHKVVVHVHSVNTIAWAVRRDAPEQLSSRLRGLHWSWIPYAASGVPLAQKIHAAVSACPSIDTFVLGNHGLVICGDSPRAALQLIGDVEARLALTPRPAPDPEPALLTRTETGSNWFLPTGHEVHSLATDPLSRQIASGGILYPCQAMFLPDTVPPLVSSLKQCCEFHRPPAVRFVDGLGVLCDRHLTPAQFEVLRGLAQVVQRLDPMAPLRYLGQCEISELLNGPSYLGATANPVSDVSRRL